DTPAFSESGLRFGTSFPATEHSTGLTPTIPPGEYPNEVPMRFAASLSILSLLAFAQNAEPPRFLAADVHVSAKTQNQGTRPPSTRGERFEVKNITMVDLIAYAYSSTAVKILGGPSWLEMDRFDVIAKQPPQTAPDTQKLMLR